MKHFLTISTMALLVYCIAIPVQGANPAFDSAADVVYNDGWQTSDNGGFGFGPWTLSLNYPGDFGVHGHFVGNSTNNGDGDTNNDGDIDINPTAALRSWGMYSNAGQPFATAKAHRPFTGTLNVGQTVRVAIDNGYVESNPTGQVSFTLDNTAGQDVFRFGFAGGQTNYLVSGVNIVGSTPGFTDEGLIVDFTLTDPDSYSLSIDSLATGVGVDNVVTGDMPPTALLGIGRVTLESYQAGVGSSFDAYFNSIQISGIPEPTALTLLTVTSLLLVSTRGLRN